VPDSPSSQEQLLSVVIPLTQMAGRMANLESWLSECAELPIEIRFVHDVQDKRTTVELAELIRKHEKLDIKLVEGIYNSPGLARNAGLKGSIAPWIAFWDSDDIPNPRKAIAAIREADPDTEVIIGNYRIESPQGTTSVEHLSQMENVAFSPGLWRMIIRSSTLGETRFDSVRMGEDQLFLIDLNLGSRNIHFYDNEIYQYFRGDGMQLTSKQDSINEVENTFILARDRIQDDPKLRDTFSEIIVLRLLLTTVFRTTQTRKLSFLIQNASIFRHLSRKTLTTLMMSMRRRREER
jgi:glycosyltransferase involved in cell wall biosynthesis